MRVRLRTPAVARRRGGSWTGPRQCSQHNVGRVDVPDRQTDERLRLQVAYRVEDELRAVNAVLSQFNDYDTTVARPGAPGDQAATLETVEDAGNCCGPCPASGPQLGDCASDAVGEV